LNEMFPTLFRQGSKGYRVIYQNNTWRLFARITDAADYKD
jgi:hypothetical protein